MAQVRPLVTAHWLQRSLIQDAAPSLRVLDASFHLPAAKRNAIEEFQKSRIPSAQFFDVDKVADLSTDLPHMLPSKEVFEEAMSTLGVSNDDHVVVYDCSAFGVFSAPRLWWTLRYFGHDAVSVLDGGMEGWKREGFPLETTPVKAPKKTNYKVRVMRPELLMSREQVEENIKLRTKKVMDARPLGRFLGNDPEPRPGLSRGHIPGSVSIPFSDLLDKEKKVMLPAHEIKKVFESRNVDLASPMAASCGSGVTACVIAFGAYLTSVASGEAPSAPAQNVAVYDGAWAEWGGLKTTQKEITDTQGNTKVDSFF